MQWFATTLKTYPEIAIFMTLALGYFFGKFTYKGIGLGSVTATLLAGVLIGQIGITIPQPLKATVFLLFLFAVGYAVGPQFVRGVAKDGLPQAIFAAVQCVLCLLVPVVIAKIAGYDLGYAAGLYSGLQKIGRASGRGRVEISGGGVSLKKKKKENSGCSLEIIKYRLRVETECTNEYSWCTKKCHRMMGDVNYIFYKLSR